VKARPNGYFYCNNSGLGYDPPVTEPTETDTFTAQEISTTVSSERPALSVEDILFNDEYVCGYCESHAPVPYFDYSISGRTATFVNTSTGGTSSVEWFINEIDTQLIFTGDTVVYHFPYAYDYTVCIHATNQCGSDTKCGKVHLKPNAVNDALSDNLKVSVAPTVFHESIRVSVLDPAKLYAEMLDASGKVCRSFELTSDMEVNLSMLSSGLYVLRVSDGRTSLHFKLIKY
jgi:hypothetical protein